MPLAVYSTDFDPTRLYATGDPGGEADVRRVIRGGDDPVDLLVDFERGVVLWYFRAYRRTKAMRTGYFYAVYRGKEAPDDGDGGAFSFVDDPDDGDQATGEDGGEGAGDGAEDPGDGGGDDRQGDDGGVFGDGSDGDGIFDDEGDGGGEDGDEIFGDDGDGADGDGGSRDDGDGEGGGGSTGGASTGGDDGGSGADGSSGDDGDDANVVGDGAGDLFRGFERELRALHDHEEWEVPHADEPHWDAGFHLWRVAPDLPGLTPDERSRLVDHLRGSGSVLEFGMQDFNHALQVVRAVEDAGVDCTVAVTREGDADSLAGVDLVLRPVGEEDFVPLSPAAAELFGAPEEGDRDVDAPTESDGEEGSSRWPGLEPGRVGVQLAVVELLALLAVATLSLFGVGPLVHTTGLATVGGLVASALAGPSVAAGLATEDRTGPATAVRRGLVDHPGRSLLVIAYGTTFAFAYPTVFGAATDLLGPGGWPVGGFGDLFASAVWPVLAAAVYVLAMLAASFVIASVHYWRRREGRLPAGLFVRLVGAHLLFGLFLVVASDVAGPLWGALGIA